MIFSTGPALPHGALSGTALLWVEQRALVQGLIRAVPQEIRRVVQHPQAVVH